MKTMLNILRLAVIVPVLLLIAVLSFVVRLQLVLIYGLARMGSLVVRVKNRPISLSGFAIDTISYKRGLPELTGGLITSINPKDEGRISHGKH